MRDCAGLDLNYTNDTRCRCTVLHIDKAYAIEDYVMPIRPRPFNLRCTVCNWTVHCRPSSDCYTPNEVPYHCKRCDSSDLEGEYGQNLRLKAFLRTYLNVELGSDGI